MSFPWKWESRLQFQCHSRENFQCHCRGKSESIVYSVAMHFNFMDPRMHFNPMDPRILGDDIKARGKDKSLCDNNITIAENDNILLAGDFFRYIPGLFYPHALCGFLIGSHPREAMQ